MDNRVYLVDGDLKRIRRHIWALGCLAGLTLALSAQSVCNLVFQCGCDPIWYGLASGCRFMPGAPGVDFPCPWCSQALWVKALVFSGSVGLGSATGILVLLSGRISLAYGVTISVVLVTLIGAAVIEGMVVGYPIGLWRVLVS